MYHSMSDHLEDQLNVCEKRAGHISQENKKLAMLRLGTIMNPQHLQGCIFAVHGMAWQSLLFRISYQSFSWELMEIEHNITLKYCDIDDVHWWFTLHGPPLMMLTCNPNAAHKILLMLSLMITHRTRSNQELVLQFLLQTLTLQFHDIWPMPSHTQSIYTPYHPCMAYVPTFGWFLW